MIRRRLALALLRGVDCVTTRGIVFLIRARDLAAQFAAWIAPDLRS